MAFGILKQSAKVLMACLAGLGLLGLVVGWMGRPDAQTRGLWRTQGYGLIVDIGNFYTNLYQISESECLRVETLPSHQSLIDRLEGVRFSGQSGRMRIEVDGIINHIPAVPLENLPERCHAPLDSSPTAVVRAVSEHFGEHYPFFDIYGVDWPARTRDALFSVNQDTTDDALYVILQKMLDGVNDGHVYVSTGETGFSPAEDLPWDQHFDTAQTVARSLTDTPMTEVENTKLSYGMLPGDVGYVHLAAMAVKSDAGFGPDIAHAAMQEAAKALRNTRAIVIDVRFNPGGSDDIALAYAATFTAERMRAFDKQIMTRNGLSDPYVAFVEERDGIVLRQPVYLLTSGYTASAAEIFALALGEMPQVQIYGDPTNGAFSDILDRQLPNGWEIGLSHQIYRTNAGVVLEGVGYPPDVEIPFDSDGFLAGRDTLVETVLSDVE